MQLTNLSKLRSELISQDCDALFTSKTELIGYYSGYFGFSNTEKEGYILITKRNIYLISGSLHKNALINSKKYIFLEITNNSNLSSILSKILNSEKIKNLGIEEDITTISEYRKLKILKTNLINFDTRLLREIKTQSEIKAIKTACLIAKKAFENIRDNAVPGITEIELSKLFEIELRKLNSESSFKTIIAFGPNSATPHHNSGKTKLKKNDIVLVDFGAKYDNYCSDCTRTFFVGNPTPEQKNVYDIVSESQKKAINYLEEAIKEPKQEIDAFSVDKAAREHIISKGYPSIPHSLGHGIGLEVHESPSISPLSRDTLREGMVFSIEPGIYISKKFGIRIEDLFTINNGRLLKLT